MAGIYAATDKLWWSRRIFFAFLSGIGCYFSLKSDCRTWFFYKKRIKRILIPYVLIAFAGYFIDDIILTGDFVLAVKDFSFFSFFFDKGKGGLWYIGFCILVYVLAPVFYRVTKNTACFVFTVVLITATVVSIYFYANDIYQAYHQTLTGLIIFCIGMYYGHPVKKSTKHQEIVIFVILVIFGVKVAAPLESKLLNDIVYSLLGIALSLFGAWILYLLNNKMLNRILVFFGKISLEIYMINHFLHSILHKLIGRSAWAYCLVLVLGCVLSICVSKFSTYLSKKII